MVGVFRFSRILLGGQLLKASEVEMIFVFEKH